MDASTPMLESVGDLVELVDAGDEDGITPVVAGGLRQQGFGGRLRAGVLDLDLSHPTPPRPFGHGIEYLYATLGVHVLHRGEGGLSQTTAAAHEKRKRGGSEGGEVDGEGRVTGAGHGGLLCVGSDGSLASGVPCPGGGAWGVA
jgi:hypothetical protein